MGKDWFGVVKRVFSPEPKEKKAVEQKSPKSKKKWTFGKSKPVDSLTEPEPEASDIPCVSPSPSPPPPPTPPVASVTLVDSKQEPNKDVYSAAIATAEAAAAAAKAAAEVVRLTTAAKGFSNRSKEEVAAIKIQAAFRAYLARKVLQSLRGLARLKSVMHGNAIKRQTTSALRCMQNLTRVQSEIWARRIRMSEENQAIQRQLQLKREKELEAMRVAMGDQWDNSLQSKEKIEASIANKYEATIRRERALAYAFSHQWRSSSRLINPMFTDPNNPQWGWSWMERWMAARPWESQCAVEKENGNDKSSVRSANLGVGGEILKAFGQRDAAGERPSPMARKSIRPGSRQSTSTPPSKTSSVTGGRMRSASPRAGYYPSEDDTRSLLSIRSENRRHSIAESSIRDDESLASSPAVPNYMVSTESARAKSRIPSPSLPSSSKIMSSDTASISSAKKRLSFPTSAKPGMLSPVGSRRQSGPPKIDVSSVKDTHSQPGSEAGDGSRR